MCWQNSNAAKNSDGSTVNLYISVQARLVAHLFRERDQYVLQYEPAVVPADFVSLTMPVQASSLWLGGTIRRSER